MRNLREEKGKIYYSICNIYYLLKSLQRMSCAAQVEGMEGGSLYLSAANLPDTVLWNPWQEKV
jgi:hypothetical protein